MTLATGIKLELCSYTILIYEIISCIVAYVFHSQVLCAIQSDNETGIFSLIFKDIDFNRTVYTGKYKQFSENLKNFFCLNKIYYAPQDKIHDDLSISDEKSYLMNLLANTANKYNDYEQKIYMNFIVEDKQFLAKYDGILHILTHGESTH